MKKAEQSLICYMSEDYQFMEKCLSSCTPDGFRDPGCSDLFAEIKRLHASMGLDTNNVHLMAVREFGQIVKEVDKDNAFQIVAINSATHMMSDKFRRFSSQKFPSYTEFMNMASSFGEDVVEMASKASKNGVKSFKDIRERPVEPRIPIGIKSMDESFQGFKCPGLNTVAGQTSVGKTAFFVSMLSNEKFRGSSRSALVISQEMVDFELLHLIIGSSLDIPVTRVSTGNCLPREVEAVKSLKEDIGDRIRIVDSMGESITDIRAAARKYLDEGDILIVDYLQILNFRDVNLGRRDLDIAAVTGSLKRLSNELGICVILNSQLSRDGAKADIPQLYHLRDSGAIEQDSDLVLFLFHNGESHSNPATVGYHLAKNRSGVAGLVHEFKFDKITQRMR